MVHTGTSRSVAVIRTARIRHVLAVSRVGGDDDIERDWLAHTTRTSRNRWRRASGKQQWIARAFPVSCRLQLCRSPEGAKRGKIRRRVL